MTTVNCKSCHKEIKNPDLDSDHRLFDHKEGWLQFCSPNCKFTFQKELVKNNSLVNVSSRRII